MPTSWRPRHNPILLALDPGTRNTGVVVFDGVDIADYHVRTFRQARGATRLLKEVTAAMRELLAEIEPGTVVIERPFLAPTKRSALLNVLVDELRSLVSVGTIRLREYGPREVREALLGNARATKRDVARHIIERYPELRHRFHPGDFWRERYWSHVFDAAALGLVELDRRQRYRRR